MSAPNWERAFSVHHDRLLTAARMVEAVRPSNWDDDEDPDQVAAWSALEESLRPFQREAGIGPSDLCGDPTEGGWSVAAQGWGVAFVFAVGVMVGMVFL